MLWLSFTFSIICDYHSRQLPCVSRRVLFQVKHSQLIFSCKVLSNSFPLTKYSSHCSPFALVYVDFQYLLLWCYPYTNTTSYKTCHPISSRKKWSQDSLRIGLRHLETEITASKVLAIVLARFLSSSHSSPLAVCTILHKTTTSIWNLSFSNMNKHCTDYYLCLIVCGAFTLFPFSIVCVSNM